MDTANILCLECHGYNCLPVVFFLLNLINLFLLFFYILFNHIINHTEFLQLNFIHSSMYIDMLFHLYIFFTMFCVCLFS